ncbi:hypothetical protein MTO96_049289 [Rhipicephalus appendiculatus]
MEVHVEGEYITQDELTAEMGWHTARSRRPAGRRGRNSFPSDSAQTQESSSKPKPKKNVKAQVLKAGRMPPLPKDEIKIILRPKGGLHISKVGSPTVTAAIFDATKITPAESQEDTICPNAQQNIIVISTPPPAQRRPIHSAQDIDANVVNARNPLALATKRIGTTTTVVIAFDGPSVPYQVRYGATLIPCSLYRKQIDICYHCGRLGHRMDVCPFPNNKICRGCGAHNPDEDHQCTPQVHAVRWTAPHGGQRVRGQVQDTLCHSQTPLGTEDDTTVHSSSQ